MSKQISLGKRQPKPLKRTTGRTATAQIPAYIRGFGVDLSQEQRARIRERLGAKLDKYANAIERISIRVSDVNGPRGGIDKECRIKVVLSGMPSVVFESHAVSLDDAVNGALTGTEHAVRRSVETRRSKSLRTPTPAEPHSVD